jgi:hypothetical protein
MARKNFPVFPVSPFSGDENNPPHRGNTGIGIYEMAMLVAMHALVTRGVSSHSPEAVMELAASLATSYVSKILDK